MLFRSSHPPPAALEAAAAAARGHDHPATKGGEAATLPVHNSAAAAAAASVPDTPSSSLAAAEGNLGRAVASASARADAGLLPAPLRALLRVASERGVNVLTWLAPEGGWPSSDLASAGRNHHRGSNIVGGASGSSSTPPPLAQYVLSADLFKEKLTQLGLGLAVHSFPSRYIYFQ